MRDFTNSVVHSTWSVKFTQRGHLVIKYIKRETAHTHSLTSTALSHK